MAYLFTRRRSPYWWVGYRDPLTGQPRQKSTGFKIGLGPDRRKAQAVRAEYAAKEAAVCSTGPEHRWEVWVPDFIAIHYAAAARTRQWVEGCWRSLSEFLREQQVVGPQQLTRQHCLSYIPWRQKQGVVLNTALKELRLLSVLVGEAQQQGMVSVNH